MIAESTIQAVRERASLLEVVGEVVSLKRQGSNHVGLCPFHSERTPSFHVREHDHHYHCFGCGASGDAISFVMAQRGLSFGEAVEDLAGRYGITVDRTDSRAQSGAPTGPTPLLLYKINQVALEYFSESLREAPSEVRDYLAKRGLSEDSIVYFGIGYAPLLRAVSVPGSLTDRLRRKGLKDDVLLASGLCRRNSRGELYDVFRGRLMFPVWLDSRRVAGFGGRVIPGLSQGDEQHEPPKYLNSPETVVYQKSKILYGVPQAIEAIRTQGTLYLVEGYMDVVGLAQAGVNNVVATCGTALTERHVKRLGNLSKRVVLLFDGDSAGQAAASKSLTVFLNSGLDVHAAFLPASQDPDDFAKQHGAACARALEELPRTGLLDAYVGGLVDRYSPPNEERDSSQVRSLVGVGAALKGRLCQELAATLGRVNNAIERAELVERAALLLKVSSTELTRMVRENGTTPTRSGDAAKLNETAMNLTAGDTKTLPSTPATGSRAPRAIGELPRFDGELLYGLMANKEELCEQFLKDADLCYVAQPETRAFAEELLEVVRRGQVKLSFAEYKAEVRALLRRYGPSWEQHWRRAYEMRNDPGNRLASLLAECRRSAEKIKCDQAVALVQERIAACQDEAERAVLIQEQVNLTRRFKGLGSAA